HCSFINPPPPARISTLSLHDALPISTRTPRTPATTIAPRPAAMRSHPWSGPQWYHWMLGLANFPVDSMPNVYAPTPTNAATPALNNPVWPHCRLRPSARTTRIVAGTMKPASWRTSEARTSARLPHPQPSPTCEECRHPSAHRMSADTHDSLWEEQEHDDHHEERAHGFVLRAAFQETSLECSENHVREFLDDPNDQAANHRPVGGTDSTDDHCGENVEEDEESEQREDVHDNREEDAGHCGEGPGDDPRPEDHVPSVDARGPCEDQVVRAGPHRLPERGEF